MSKMRLPLQTSDAYRWFVVAMLWCACFLNYADRQLLFTVFPLLGREFRLSDGALSVLSACFMGTYALFGPLAGIICDRVPRNVVLVATLVFWSATAVATAFAHRYSQLVLGVALSGLGEAFYFPAAISIIADYHGAGTRSRAMSIHQSSVYIGSIVGGAMAGYLGQFYGWRGGFRIFGGVGIALGCGLWLMLKEPVRGQSENAAKQRGNAGSLLAGLRAITRNPAAWLMICVFAGANFVAMVFTVWLPTFLYRKFHMSLGMSGLSGTAYLQTASVVGVVLGGVLADQRVRQRTGDKGARMVIQSLGLFCGVPFLFLSGWTSTLAVVLAAMIGFGVSKGIYDSNLWASLFDVVQVEDRGMALGVMNSLGWLGGAAAQLSIGMASERFGMSACLSATALIYLVIAAALMAGSRRISHGSQADSLRMR